MGRPWRPYAKTLFMAWSHQLSKKEASKITIAEVFGEECW